MLPAISTDQGRLLLALSITNAPELMRYLSQSMRNLRNSSQGCLFRRAGRGLKSIDYLINNGGTLRALRCRLIHRHVR